MQDITKIIIDEFKYWSDIKLLESSSTYTEDILYISALGTGYKIHITKEPNYDTKNNRMKRSQPPYSVLDEI